MPRTVDELFAEIHALEAEVEASYDRQRERMHFVMEDGRARFTAAVVEQQRRVRVPLGRYLAYSRPLVWLVSPIIYFGWIPLAFLDLFFTVYQTICFPAYGIAKVKRSEYLVLDRGDLPYLNALQKFNCFYCGYANGLAAYFREIAARTEQYWCPIKHARRVRDAHDRYPTFFEYGDAETFRAGLEKLRKELELANGE